MVHSTGRASAQGHSLLARRSSQSGPTGPHRGAACMHRNWSPWLVRWRWRGRSAMLASEEPRAAQHKHRGWKGVLSGMASVLEAHQNDGATVRADGGWRDLHSVSTEGSCGGWRPHATLEGGVEAHAGVEVKGRGLERSWPHVAATMF
jgi:hypothetical protein